MNDALRAVALQNAVAFATANKIQSADAVVGYAEAFGAFLSGAPAPVKTPGENPAPATNATKPAATKPAATKPAPAKAPPKKAAKTEEQLAAEAAAAAAEADAAQDGEVTEAAVKAVVDALLKANKRQETIDLLASHGEAKSASGIVKQGQEVMAAFLAEATELLEGGALTD